MVAVLGLLLSGVVDRGPLLNAGIMAFPLDFRVRWEVKNALHRLPADGEYVFWGYREVG